MIHRYIATEKTAGLVYHFEVEKANGECTIKNLDTGAVRTYKPIDKVAPKTVFDLYLLTSYIGRKFEVKKEA